MRVRLVCGRSRVQSSRPAKHSFVEIWSWKCFYDHFLPSVDSRRAVVSYWGKNGHYVLVNCLGCLPRNSVARLTDRTRNDLKCVEGLQNTNSTTTKSSVWGMILHWGSTIKVSIEFLVATRHCCCMTEKFLYRSISWKLIFGYKVQRLIGRKSFHCAMYLLPLDHCIQKSTFNQSELVYRMRKFAEWPLDMYHSVGHVSFCWTCIALLHSVNLNKQQQLALNAFMLLDATLLLQGFNSSC